MTRTAAVIGIGAAGIRHVEGYREAGIEVTHIADLNPEQIIYGVTTKRHWREVIGKTDFLSVCSYDDWHAEQVSAGLRAGQAVFCEKPLCLSIDELGLIEIASDRIGSRLGVNYPLRHVRAFKELKAKIATGTFGEIYFIEALYHWGRRHKLAEPRFQRPFSMMMAGGIHMVDLVRWLSGSLLEPVAVSASDHVEIGSHAHGLIIADFGSARGDHFHEVRIHGTEDRTTVRNFGPTDKTACLKDFIAGYDDPTIFEVTEACLKMSG